jgi:hypothetical protein
MTKKIKIKFIAKVAITHVLTYIICGIVFSQIFDYQSSLVESTNRRDMNSLLVQMAPLFQIIRGILFGIVLLWIKDSFISRKYGWLKLWLTLIILGVFNTPATSPFSIEEFIYVIPSNEPLSLQLGGLLEILVQTILFSILITYKSPTKE